MLLHQKVLETAAREGDRAAIIESGGAALTYADLEQLSAEVRDCLLAILVEPGDRVGVCLRKSADAIAAFLGILRAGAAYVPLDASAPAVRNAGILANCEASVLFAELADAGSILGELSKLGKPCAVIALDQVGRGDGLRSAVRRLREDLPFTPDCESVDVAVDPDSPAYLLHTSGSTGQPKGVTLSHKNGLTFVNWCDATFAPTRDDRFSAHAPFHFDLSIFDIWVSLRRGATICLIDEGLGKDPARLPRHISESGITIWYSAPSILSLMAARGGIEMLDFSRLRLVLFAGEVFPVVHLRTLRALWPRPRFFNLYGPTETNVCTYYELPEGPIPDARVEPFPIGKVCPPLRAALLPLDAPAAPGEPRELVIAGDGVMRGYWGRPDLTEAAFVAAPDGARWYRTGDLVTVDENDNFVYRGRRDRMIKKRGYRVELGEIESCLYQHENIREAAIVASPDDDLGTRVTAHLATKDGGRISLVQLKQFCARSLPVYMIPDRFVFHAALPKTSTDKTDVRALATLSETSARRVLPP